MTEIFTLDLDYDFLAHLADEASVLAIRKEAIAPELVEDEEVREVFEWQFQHLREHGKPATGTVLEAEFPNITINEPQTVIDDLLRRLRERYGRNTGQELITELAHIAVDEPTVLGQEMLKHGRKLTTLLTAKGESVGTGDFDAAMERYDRLVQRGRGPSFGFSELDEHFYGQLGLTFLVGAPKSYKSWFTINAVVENILDGKFPFLYSLELPAEETDMRLRCMIAGVPYWKYLKRGLLAEDREKLREASEYLDRSGVYRIEKPKLGERTVERMIDRARDAGADCIFIDQLQYIEYNKRTLGGRNDPGEYWEVCQHLRDYSDEGPIWIVHQFNRSIMGAESMPDIQQIKGSSGVEETATLCLGLWANKEMRKSNLLQLGTMISRNFGLPAWEAKVDLTKTSEIKLIGTVDE